MVLTFLYTSCWDLCPAQAAEVLDAVERAGAERVVVYAVSVDPVGDTPEHVHELARGPRPRRQPVEYLTGTRAELAPVWRAYGISPIGATPRSPRRHGARTSSYEEEEEAEGAEEEEEHEYEPPVRPAPDEARQEYPDVGDLSYRGRPRHVAGQDFEHSAYVLLIDPQGEQRVGFPFEQLEPALLARDIRLLRG